MTVTGVSTSAVPNPMLTFAQAQQSETSALFGDTQGTMESTAAAYELYNQPQVLIELTQWDGSQTPGSQRVVAATPDIATQGVQPKWEFNPFDQKKWDVAPTGSTFDAQA